MRDRLRILAYHGFALGDENRFRPELFMESTLFCRRIEYLLRKGYPILRLDDALQRLTERALPHNAVVITCDDGFYSTWALAIPFLFQHCVPCTIYVTSYYVVKGNPVFRLVVQYKFWKTDRSLLDLSGLGLPDMRRVSLADPRATQRVAWELICYGEKAMKEEERVALCDEIGKRLGVPYDRIVENRFLSLMTPEELRQAAAHGVDIELHTHRHELPTDSDGSRREIADNQDALELMIGRRPRHFCYPSGIHETEHYEHLREAGILTATTCDPGLTTGSIK